MPDPMQPELDVESGARSVLVAVNGRESGWQALDWAAAECAARRSPLCIVHVINNTLLMLDPLGGGAYAWLADAPDSGARVLDEATRRARLVTPNVVISTRLETGFIAAGIRRASRAHALTVIGRGRSMRLGVRSAGWRIAWRAHGPVAIVELDDERRSGPSAGRVVLGIDEAAGPPAAVAYAFRAASRRGVGLTVIHACALRTRIRRRKHSARFLDDMRRLVAIDEAVQAYGHAFPNVDVRRRFVTGPAGAALVAESDGAALLVIGEHSPRRLDSRLTAVARTALRCARSPVAIIRTPEPARLVRDIDGSRDHVANRSSLGTAPDV
jgi:nucleotide-binding universal stress UspA family protein